MRSRNTPRDPLKALKIKSQSLFLNITVCKLELCSMYMSILHVVFLVSILLWLWCLVVPDTAALNVCGFILSISLNRILKSLGAGSQSLCALTFQGSVLMSTGLSPASSCIISSGTHVSYTSINAFSGLLGEDIPWWRSCSQQGSSVQVHIYIGPKIYPGVPVSHSIELAQNYTLQSVSIVYF